MFMEMSFIIYLVGNVYLLRRAWKALAGTGVFRQIVLILYLIFSYSYFLWHKIERGRPTVFKETICAMGSFYTGVLLYLVLFTALVDLLRLIDHFFPFFPRRIRENRWKAGRAAFFAIVGITFALLFGGMAYARHVRVNTMEIEIGKKAGERGSLNLVFFSDIHVGPFLRTARLEKIVEQINSLEPDVVLILGDIMNEEALSSEREQLPITLGKIQARFGVYACLGNHEHFAGIKNSLELFRKSRITALQNQAALVAGSFYLVGRSNRSYIGQNERRMPLKEILKDADMNLPVILMDHQPVRLEEAAEAGVDLELCGHTHGGAVFPITLVDNLFYEISRGYGRKLNTQYYVTSGVGVWTPPARIGTTSEIVQMKVKFLPPIKLAKRVLTPNLFGVFFFFGVACRPTIHF